MTVDAGGTVTSTASDYKVDLPATGETVLNELARRNDEHDPDDLNE
jgi:hypothetical protein